jgi:hypothetical protein
MALPFYFRTPYNSHERNEINQLFTIANQDGKSKFGLTRFPLWQAILN